jgi:hypothetical protein
VFHVANFRAFLVLFYCTILNKAIPSFGKALPAGTGTVKSRSRLSVSVLCTKPDSIVRYPSVTQTCGEDAVKISQQEEEQKKSMTEMENEEEEEEEE